MLASWKVDNERLIRIREVSTFGLAQIVVVSQMHSSPVYQTPFYCVGLDHPGANRDEWPALWREYGSSRCTLSAHSANIVMALTRMVRPLYKYLRSVLY